MTNFFLHTAITELTKYQEKKGLSKHDCLLTAEFFVEGLGSLHIGSCSDIIVNHASKIKLPWFDTDEQKAYKKFRYSQSNTDKTLHDEVYYFRNRFNCMTSQ